MRVSSNSDAINTNDALKTLEAIAFMITGNPYGETKESELRKGGMQKIRKAVTKRFLWKTWTEYEYYPSGTINIQGYHKMDKNGNMTRSETLMDIPLKGAKIFL